MVFCELLRYSVLGVPPLKHFTYWILIFCHWRYSPLWGFLSVYKQQALLGCLALANINEYSIRRGVMRKGSGDSWKDREKRPNSLCHNSASPLLYITESELVSQWEQRGWWGTEGTATTEDSFTCAQQRKDQKQSEPNTKRNCWGETGIKMLSTFAWGSGVGTRVR